MSGGKGCNPPPHKNPVKKLEGMPLFPILLLLTNLDMITPIKQAFKTQSEYSSA